MAKVEYRRVRKPQQETLPVLCPQNNKKQYNYQKKENGKNATGAPEAEYNEKDNPRIVYAACRMGATMEELSNLLGVSLSTVWKWRHEHEEFKNSIITGSDEFASRCIEVSLRERAEGYEYDEIKEEGIIFTTKTHKGEKIEVPAIKRTVTRKKIAPDPLAIIFWLRNRQPERWKDVRHIIGQVNYKGVMDHNHKGTVKFDINKLEREQVESMRDIIERATQVTADTGSN